MFLLYPRFYFFKQLWGHMSEECGKCRLEIGASVGEFNRRYSVGTTLMLTKWLQVGYKIQMCPSLKRTLKQINAKY